MRRRGAREGTNDDENEQLFFSVFDREKVIEFLLRGPHGKKGKDLSFSSSEEEEEEDDGGFRRGGEEDEEYSEKENETSKTKKTTSKTKEQSVSMTTMKAKSFREFYETHYLAERKNPKTKLMHFTGTSLSIFFFIWGVIGGHISPLHRALFACFFFTYIMIIFQWTLVRPKDIVEKK